MTAYDYLQLHSEFGQIYRRTNKLSSSILFNLHHQVQLIGSHGHTVFHMPQNGFTAQLGSGADIAAVLV